MSLERVWDEWPEAMVAHDAWLTSLLREGEHFSFHEEGRSLGLPEPRQDEWCSEWVLTARLRRDDGDKAWGYAEWWGGTWWLSPSLEERK